MRDFVQDIRYAVRTFRQTPVFTTVVVLSLALGIGSNSALFSAIDAMFLRDLPIKDAGTIVSLLTGILFGIAPAVRATRMDLNSAVKQGGRNISRSRAGIGRRCS